MPKLSSISTLLCLICIIASLLLAIARGVDDIGADTYTTEDARALLTLARESRYVSDYSKAVKYYRSIIENGASTGKVYSEALNDLAELYETEGLATVDPIKAFELLVKAANVGHPVAQHKLAVAYSTGIYTSLTPIDLGRALILENFAALAGNPEAHMGMGYRYLKGLGVQESCEKALPYYEYAANYAATQIEARGYTLFADRVRLSEQDGIDNSKREIDVEVVDYYMHLADEGDISAAVSLAWIYLQGSERVDQNISKASEMFRRAADWGHVGASGQLGYMILSDVYRKMKSGYPKRRNYKVDEWLAASGISSYSRFVDDKEDILYANGQTTGYDDTLVAAVKLCRYAHNRGDSMGTTGLGFSALMGLGVEMNVSRALDYLQSAAARHNSEANFLMGEFLMGLRGDTLQPNRPSSDNDGHLSKSKGRQKNTPSILAAATKRVVGRGEKHMPYHDFSTNDQHPPDFAASAAFYSSAVQKGHHLAIHRLAHMSMNGFGVVKSCVTAVNSFKAFAERADWSRKLTIARRFFENLRPADNETLVAFYALDSPPSHPIKLETRVNVEKKPSSSLLLMLLGKVIHGFLNIDIFYFWRMLHANNSTNISSHSKSNLFHSIIRKTSSLENMNKKTALALYAQLAAIGYESAQSNAAYIISKEFCPTWISSLNIQNSTILSKGSIRPSVAEMERTQDYMIDESGPILPDISSWRTAASVNDTTCDSRALLLYGLSALQINSDSYLRVGDFFYYGKAGISQNKETAVKFYQLAASQRNSHAIFNLGLMHEVGDGVVQDFHLAKRFYDQAAEFDSGAKLPRRIALMLLSSHKSLTSIVGAEYTDSVVNSIAGYFPNLVKFINRFIAKTQVRSNDKSPFKKINVYSLFFDTNTKSKQSRQGYGSFLDDHDISLIVVFSIIYLGCAHVLYLRTRRPNAQQAFPIVPQHGLL